MPRAKSRKSTLFIANDDRCREVRQEHMDIHVGIWWHNERQIVGFAQPIAAIQEPMALIDSDLSHADAWGMARRQISCPSDVEYFAIPRGRVLWHAGRELGILYHGNSTQPEVLRVLARLFGLPKWEACLDEHYLTGDASDACMSQE